MVRPDGWLKRDIETHSLNLSFDVDNPANIMASNIVAAAPNESGPCLRGQADGKRGWIDPVRRRFRTQVPPLTLLALLINLRDIGGRLDTEAHGDFFATVVQSVPLFHRLRRR